ncbi:bifunctional 5,10-methylenetetrahydrofolate dehydrogenase/5,10-methenyltetrahydrofolate cyclohydrolase, partial [Candidatus Gottesmanbacteria bacterium]|nr:bifunctional 5,10-methylenetetrahydrofolate dehydrogenase/5,10-methenyltetrahydrofolate cyclohydrolase [Candidatus Gottesmanbacteria bacterium]
MKIDGRRIAEGILASLKKDVNLLKEKDVTPTLAIILVGDDPASVSFIRQKRIAAEKIGANLTSDQLPISTTTKVLKERMENYNKDPDIHGIIIQRPLPKDSPIDRNILLTVSPQKDVDGFVPNSSFHAPVADAVFTLLEKIHTTAKDKNIVI